MKINFPLLEGKYEIDKDNYININTDFQINKKNTNIINTTGFPDYITFGTINGNFTVDEWMGLLSLSGFPKKVTGFFRLSKCYKLTEEEVNKYDVDTFQIVLLGCVNASKEFTKIIQK